MLEMIHKILGITATIKEIKEKVSQKASIDRVIDLTGKFESIMEKKLTEVCDQVEAKLQLYAPDSAVTIQICTTVFKKRSAYW